MYHRVEELERLPDYSVVYDHNNQVFQKLVTSNAWPLGETRPEPGVHWFRPGDTTPYVDADIALPARLLDDGL